MTDAASTNGDRFVFGHRRSGGFLGLFDAPPKIVGESVTRRHLDARRSWPEGEEGVQVSWSDHGRVHIIALKDGTEVAAWNDELYEIPQRLGRFRHNNDPATDFITEVEAIERAVEENNPDGRHRLLVRIERAMEFKVGGIQPAVEAKNRLRELEEKMKSGAAN